MMETDPVPHVELNSLSVPPGAAAWTVVGLVLLAGLCFLGLALVCFRRSQRAPAGTRTGAHRSTGPTAAGTNGGDTVVCAALGVALVTVATTMITGIAGA